VAIEFALGALMFFSMLFFIMEVARVFYLWNTMVLVTSRAARMASNSDLTGATQFALKTKAMFLSSGGILFGSDLDEDNLVVDYLNNDLNPVSIVPVCPEQNMIACASDPDAATCVRFVRVRLCATGSACSPAPYKALFDGGLIPSSAFSFPMHTSIRPAGTLGYRAGAASTCP
jgi:hypothetical protein